MNIENSTNKKTEVINRMKSTWQIQDKLSVYDHGVSVLKETKKIINILSDKNIISHKLVPDFLFQHRDQILSNLVDYKTLYLYTLYHDCGKPFCKPDS